MSGDAMNDVTIVEAGPVMAPELSQLHALCFAPLPETPWPESAFRTVLQLPGTMAWAGHRDEGRALALLIGRESTGEAEVLTLCVAPEVRRSGLARTLMDTFLSRVGGGTRVTLEVAVDNHPARALYESLGFAAAGRRPGYYASRGRGVDALILVREARPV